MWRGKQWYWEIPAEHGGLRQFTRIHQTKIHMMSHFFRLLRASSRRSDIAQQTYWRPYKMPEGRTKRNGPATILHILGTPSAVAERSSCVEYWLNLLSTLVFQVLPRNNAIPKENTFVRFITVQCQENTFELAFSWRDIAPKMCPLLKKILQKSVLGHYFFLSQ